ncbi:MAG: carbohydrate kinase [Thioalkalivibrio sp.]|nr:MAG: carbohydrate kinase [Thioalkalivibrio sp.]
MARILVTGNATIDHIVDLAAYPREDSEGRALGSDTRPGGNAANTAAILAQAGHQVDLAAVVAEGHAGDRLLELLAARGIGVERCVRRPGRTPTSWILRSRATGSRTIVHDRELPELDAGAFREEGLAGYDWFHFEGRNPGRLPALLRAVRRVAVDQPVSLELEKPREGIESSLRLADVLMFSSGWARAHGRSEPEAFIAGTARARPGAVQTLTWGDRGAWVAQHGRVTHCAPRAGLQVRDSLGAGDTFNAGLIHALISGEPPETALERAVRLAERKLQRAGLDGLFGPVAR